MITPEGLKNAQCSSVEWSVMDLERVMGGATALSRTCFQCKAPQLRVLDKSRTRSFQTLPQRPLVTTKIELVHNHLRANQRPPQRLGNQSNQLKLMNNQGLCIFFSCYNSQLLITSSSIYGRLVLFHQVCRQKLIDSEFGTVGKFGTPCHTR